MESVFDHSWFPTCQHCATFLLSMWLFPHCIPSYFSIECLLLRENCSTTSSVFLYAIVFYQPHICWTDFLWASMCLLRFDWFHYRWHEAISIPWPAFFPQESVFEDCNGSHHAKTNANIKMVLITSWQIQILQRFPSCKAKCANRWLLIYQAKTSLNIAMVSFMLRHEYMLIAWLLTANPSCQDIYWLTFLKFPSASWWLIKWHFPGLIGTNIVEHSCLYSQSCSWVIKHMILILPKYLLQLSLQLPRSRLLSSSKWHWETRNVKWIVEGMSGVVGQSAETISHTFLQLFWLSQPYYHEYGTRE